IVEQAEVRDLFRAPKHPYTRALLASMPRLGKRTAEPLKSISGNVPVPINKPHTCGFFPRCPEARPGICDRAIPALTDVSAGAAAHKVACFLHSDATRPATEVAGG
ncbi:MAG: oligopeptide/dipeptide ABC transporter ATP-binding protein, partial [Pseudomonadota bacterium]